MDQSKVALVVDVEQIVVVVVDLDGSKLALVDHVLVRQRTNVEPVVQTNGVSGLLSEHVKLQLKQLLELGVPFVLSVRA